MEFSEVKELNNIISNLELKNLEDNEEVNNKIDSLLSVSPKSEIGNLNFFLSNKENEEDIEKEIINFDEKNQKTEINKIFFKKEDNKLMKKFPPDKNEKIEKRNFEKIENDKIEINSENKKKIRSSLTLQFHKEMVKKKH